MTSTLLMLQMGAEMHPHLPGGCGAIQCFDQAQSLLAILSLG